VNLALTLSILVQNLRELSDGLEGRTSNPVALVFDQLTHPYADIGMRIPSQIKWQHKADRSLSHIVIGKGPPGGVWQVCDTTSRAYSTHPLHVQPVVSGNSI